MLDAGVAPLGVELGEPVLHLERHAQAGLGVLGLALGFRVAEEDQHRVADELVDGAAVLNSAIVRHFGEIFVEQLRDLLGLQPLGGRGEVLDVGEEDRELLALGVDGDVLLAAEDALVDLRRQVARDLHRQRSEEIVGGFQLAFMPLMVAACRRCMPMNVRPDAAMKDEIGQQVLEREDVGGDRLRDGDLLDAAHVADLPVALRAFGMRVVAVHAGRAHDHRRDQADAVAEQRATDRSMIC